MYDPGTTSARKASRVSSGDVKERIFELLQEIKIQQEETARRFSFLETRISRVELRMNRSSSTRTGSMLTLTQNHKPFETASQESATSAPKKSSSSLLHPDLPTTPLAYTMDSEEENLVVKEGAKKNDVLLPVLEEFESELASEIRFKTPDGFLAKPTQFSETHFTDPANEDTFLQIYELPGEEDTDGAVPRHKNPAKDQQTGFDNLHIATAPGPVPFLVPTAIVTTLAPNQCHQPELARLSKVTHSEKLFRATMEPLRQQGPRRQPPRDQFPGHGRARPPPFRDKRLDHAGFVTACVAFSNLYNMVAA